MKLRWKLLCILLFITTVPMLTISFMNRKTSHELVEDMTTRPTRG